MFILPISSPEGIESVALVKTGSSTERELL